MNYSFLTTGAYSIALEYPTRPRSCREKQRFSRTAFEFPIRIDAKAYLHWAGAKFSTWVRARRACAYVWRLLFVGFLAGSSLAYTLPGRYEYVWSDVGMYSVPVMIAVRWHWLAIMMCTIGYCLAILVRLGFASGSLGSHLQSQDTIAIQRCHSVPVSSEFDCGYLIVLLYDFYLHF